MAANQTHFKQNKIYNTLINLINLPKVSLKKLDELQTFEIRHEQMFVPDFQFQWCSVKEHYRVYILIADRDNNKRMVGYPICTVGTGFAAMGFGVIYGFLHKHRANNKEAAYAAS